MKKILGLCVLVALLAFLSQTVIAQRSTARAEPQPAKQSWFSSVRSAVISEKPQTRTAPYELLLEECQKIESAFGRACLDPEFKTALTISGVVLSDAIRRGVLTGDKDVTIEEVVDKTYSSAELSKDNNANSLAWYAIHAKSRLDETQLLQASLKFSKGLMEKGSLDLKEMLNNMPKDKAEGSTEKDGSGGGSGSLPANMGGSSMPGSLAKNPTVSDCFKPTKWTLPEKADYNGGSTSGLDDKPVTPGLAGLAGKSLSELCKAIDPKFKKGGQVSGDKDGGEYKPFLKVTYKALWVDADPNSKAGAFAAWMISIVRNDNGEFLYSMYEAAGGTNADGTKFKTGIGGDLDMKTAPVPPPITVTVKGADGKDKEVVLTPKIEKVEEQMQNPMAEGGTSNDPCSPAIVSVDQNCPLTGTDNSSTKCKGDVAKSYGPEGVSDCNKKKASLEALNKELLLMRSGEPIINPGNMQMKTPNQIDQMKQQPNTIDQSGQQPKP